MGYTAKAIRKTTHGYEWGVWDHRNNRFVTHDMGIETFKEKRMAMDTAQSMSL